MMSFDFNVVVGIERGNKARSEVTILSGEDANEWSVYLDSLLASTFNVLPYTVSKNTLFSNRDYSQFRRCKCLLVLLSPQLVELLALPQVEQGLQRALYPGHKVVLLFCGVTETTELQNLFRDWKNWKQVSCDDEPTVFISAVEEAINESYGRDSGCDTTESELQAEPQAKVRSNVAKSTVQLCSQTFRDPQENTVKVLPDRIPCGTPQQIFVILKVKLDTKVKCEIDFTFGVKAAVRVPAMFVNEYMLSAQAPDMPSGLITLTIYSGDLKVSSATLVYYTDMEEIENLLRNAVNPVEFMCQAFHIVPYNRETLDKLLTESLRRNMPSNGLHIFGINQLEEDDLSTTQRDEELPTLLHFAAMYGLKNLTALLLQCPGALQAYSVANRHGDYPNNMAEKNGFRDLRQFMDEYVETADMLKTHLKEELCGDIEGERDEDLYESMAIVSKDILMKCTLNPGCDEDIYESMMEILPPSGVMDSTYEPMSNLMGAAHVSTRVPDTFGSTTDCILRKFLQGNNDKSVDCDGPGEMEEAGVYDTMPDDDNRQEIMSRPPLPVPRLHTVPDVDDMKPYISKVFCNKEEKRPENLYVTALRSTADGSSGPAIPPRTKQPLSRAPSSDYDPFAGMKTPGQRQLITLQEQVKLGMINVDEALLQFKEWQLNQKRRSESFRFQQENLKKLRDSITRRQNIKGKSSKHQELEITLPARSNDQIPENAEYGVYEENCRFIPPCTSREGIQRGMWKTGSTSSTASSLSSRSSTRSILSLSSGAEGDNEDNEAVDCGPVSRPLSRHRPPSLPPPRIPPRIPARNPPQPLAKVTPAPPVPPRGR
ncbi:phosphoinositide 3-kinase adapter protein 1 isoform X1 [Chiloscyllium plagiosum]|uniref:phosphoinositide 3-kinase adapter protein 1 isoform X1 n=1 Tax=Chiloscyllium plagiosum TaxID=36176 RepID=UPI001CB866F5|nr:phosphoinositide 3-kinase adapter protein 1 isoform X1 [Chiloscyllium plagiosum]